MAELVGARPRQLRTFRARRDVLDELPDPELIKRYRLDRAGILFVADLVREALTAPTNRNQALSPEMKVLVTLRYLATGKMQQCSSDDLGPSQQTVIRVTRETVYALAQPHIVRRFIKFPLTVQETQVKRREFEEIAGFPGVVGAVDGTHVRIVAPKEFEAEYVNRKGHHSINVQIVCDTHGRILHQTANWPGSVHDARILRESALFTGFERGMVPAGCHLLGDSAYPSKKWLLTPYVRPQPGPQSAYNRAHKRTRSTVERGIGQWKRRFHVLHGEIRVSPPAYVCRIIQVCAILHNICKDRRLPVPEEGEDEGDGAVFHEDPPVPLPPVPGRVREGLLYRDEFVNLHFIDRPQPQPRAAV
ncbi:putative nuclease HARBI1 [Eriocheir sinensis]|uniref:putative nuclease HARBI1 n=1 Tax=Eriocheir sinensis TaxID=95602 RepID=UPI0021C989D2|nr:putative nuclease HARBI1 [Eriocheir sinensis]